MLDDFKSIYLQDKFIEKSVEYIKPIEIQLDIRSELRLKNNFPQLWELKGLTEICFKIKFIVSTKTAVLNIKKYKI